VLATGRRQPASTKCPLVARSGAPGRGRPDTCSELNALLGATARDVAEFAPDQQRTAGQIGLLFANAGVMGACSALRSLSAQKCSAVEMPRAGGALFGERMQKSGRATYRCPAGGFGGCLAGCANRGGRSGVGRCVVG
jgi:hypothetical protein